MHDAGLHYPHCSAEEMLQSVLMMIGITINRNTNLWDVISMISDTRIHQISVRIVHPPHRHHMWMTD
jgi:hypothetical protein